MKIKQSNLKIQTQEDTPQTQVNKFQSHEDNFQTRETQIKLSSVTKEKIFGFLTNNKIRTDDIIAVWNQEIFPKINANIKLTKRESECFYYLAQGKSIKKIAQELKLSIRTVEMHINSIKDKMGIFSKSELVEKACEWLFHSQLSIIKILTNKLENIINQNHDT